MSVGMSELYSTFDIDVDEQIEAHLERLKNHEGLPS